MAKAILASHRARSISEAAEGAVVKIAGTIRAAERTLRAPISDRECVYHEVVLREDPMFAIQEGKFLVRDREAVDFFVEDALGRALVRTSNIQVVALRDVDETAWSGYRGDVTKILKQHGKTPSFTRVQVRECTLALGERVVVVGEGSWIADSSGKQSVYRASQRTLVLTAPADHPLIVSDDPETFD